MFPAVKARGHHHDVFSGCVSVLQHFLQACKIARVAHGDQNISWTHCNLAAVQVLALADPELLHVFVRGAALVRVMLRYRKHCKKTQAERDAGNGRVRLVNKLIMATANSTSVITPSPAGISTRPMRKLPGTRHSRFT